MEKLVVKFRIENEIRFFVINDISAFSLNQINEEVDYNTLKNICDEITITVNDFEYFKKDLIDTNIIKEIQTNIKLVVTTDRIVLFNKEEKQFCVYGDNYALDMDEFDIVDKETSKKVLDYLDVIEETMIEENFFGGNGEALIHRDDENNNIIVFTRWSDEAYYYTFEKNF